MATSNTGGWQLTTSTYANGGRMETVGDDGKVTATVNNDATKAALANLKAMRWEDNSLGSTFDYDPPDALVTALVKWAHAKGATIVCLDVIKSNIRATRFYERHRFRPSGTETPRENDGRVEVRMQLTIG